MTIVKNSAGQEIRNETFYEFVKLLVDYLYQSYRADLNKIVEPAMKYMKLNYGGSQCITGVFSPDYINSGKKVRTFKDIYTFPGKGDFYLSTQWCANPDPTGANRDLDHIKEMIDIKFSQYDVISDAEGFKLVSKNESVVSSSIVNPKKLIDIVTTRDSLLRIDYSYLTHLVIGKAAPISHFDTAAMIMSSAGNVLLLSLMDRIPVYVVDSEFMKSLPYPDDIEFDPDLFQCLKRLANILRLLEQLLPVFSHDVSEGRIDDIVYQIKKYVQEAKKLIARLNLLQIAPWLSVVSEIERFIHEIEKWGLHRAAGNDNFKPMLEHLIATLKDILETRFRMPHVEYLGVYCPEWKKYSPDGKSFRHEKAIFVCWERIKDCAEEGHQVDLLTKVTIHEFCHAYMDIMTLLVNRKKDVYHWMEESMANVMTLLITEKYVIKHPSNLSLLNYFKEFMLKQPDAYASAVTMWENGICDYDMWAWKKDCCLTAPSVQRWHAYMNLKYKTIKAEEIRSLWRDVRKEILGV